MNMIILVRHGENRANLTKEFSYKLVDYPLNEKGVLQAQQTGEFLRQETIHAIYSSPLKRAAQTAEIIGDAIGLTPVISEAFREVNVGDLERQPPTEEAWTAFRNVTRAWMEGQLETSYPHGENYHQLWARYQYGLREAITAHPDQNLLIVGHGGLFTITLPDLCPDVQINDLLHAENHNTSLTRVAVHLEGEQPVGTLLDWASTHHLSGAAADLVSGSPNHGDLD